MGNIFAFSMLIIWPLTAIQLYKRKTIQAATLWTILGGFMLLPAKTEVDLPLIPPMGKDSIPVVSAIIGCVLVKGKGIKYFSSKGMLKLLVLMMMVSPFLTTALNGDTLIIGDTFMRGLNYHDALSATINQLIFITPFFIGKQFFRSYPDQLLMFQTLAVAGLIYSFPMLFEIRMSPQLHSWVYGYFPHDFGQQMRAGGFRPVVFMGHGLWVAFFTAIVVIATCALWKNKEKIRQFPASKVTIYMLVVLVLCKSMASLIYAVVAIFMIKLLAFKQQLRIVIILVMLAISYPLMSIMEIFPHQRLAEAAVNYMGEERAQSLVFRFDNEYLLLNHGRERFFFGWGGFGRNRVYNEETGEDETVTDGRWIITFGQFGWFGFFAEFGLLSIAVFRAKKASKWLKTDHELTLLYSHALVISLIMIDQLPNATLAPWMWLLVGILLGRSEEIIASNKAQKTNKHASIFRET